MFFVSLNWSLSSDPNNRLNGHAEATAPHWLAMTDFLLGYGHPSTPFKRGRISSHEAVGAASTALKLPSPRSGTTLMKGSKLLFQGFFVCIIYRVLYSLKINKCRFCSGAVFPVWQPGKVHSLNSHGCAFYKAVHCPG